jgi:hypothetical protein
VEEDELGGACSANKEEEGLVTFIGTIARRKETTRNIKTHVT